MSQYTCFTRDPGAFRTGTSALELGASGLVCKPLRSETWFLSPSALLNVSLTGPQNRGGGGRHLCGCGIPPIRLSVAFSLYPQLCRVLSSHLQGVTRDSCCTCSCILGVFVGGGEPGILLLCHLDPTPPIISSNIFFLPRLFILSLWDSNYIQGGAK